MFCCELFNAPITVGYGAAYLLWGKNSEAGYDHNVRGGTTTIASGGVLICTAIDTGSIALSVTEGANPAELATEPWPKITSAQVHVNGQLRVLSLDMSDQTPDEDLGPVSPGRYEVTVWQWHDASHIDAIRDYSATERAWIHLRPLEE